MKKYILLLTLFILQSTSFSYNAVLFNGAGLSSQDRLLVMTLAGIVNRDSARLYLLNVYETWSYNKTDEQWRDLYRSKGNVVFDSISSISLLIEKFRSLINGGISYDANRNYSNFSGQSFKWQGEYASLIGGLTDRLPVTPSMAVAYNLSLSDSVLVQDSFDSDPPVWVTGKLEVSSNPWNNTSLTEEQRYFSIIDWGIKTLLPRCNPSKFYIREITDFTVRKKMFQVNLAASDDLNLNAMPVAKADLLERILTFMHLKNPADIFHIYGWIRPEPMTQWFATFGASFHETLLGNLSWHSSFNIPARSFVPKSKVNPDTIKLEDKYYLIFVSTEGDASNWVFGFQSGAWLSPHRGVTPIAWGWNFHLLNECPFVAAYYYDTATPNDGFLSVTSPLGYAFPDLWQNDVWNGAVDSTKYLMNKFGVKEIYGYKHYAGAGTMVYRGKTISNSFGFTKYGQFQSAIGANLTLLFDPLLPSQSPVTNYGSLMFNHVGDGSFYGVSENLNTMAARIITNIKKQTRPGFLLAGYQRFRQEDFSSRIDPSDADITPLRLTQVVQMIKADPAVGNYIEVVTPETFSVLMRKKLGLLNIQRKEMTVFDYSLSQNYPNPFNPSTVISYSLKADCKVKLVIYNTIGQIVKELVNSVQSSGYHDVKFDAGNLSSGIYFYSIEASPADGSAKFTSVRKAVLLK